MLPVPLFAVRIIRGQVFHTFEEVPVVTTSLPRRKAGRPPKIIGTAHRWWLYCSRESRAAAQARADEELPDGLDLGDVMRAALDDYATHRYTPALPAPVEESA
jgi:hypothetical protein